MIDAWTGPAAAPQQFPPNEPNGIRALLDKIAALELRIKEATSNLLGSAGIRLTRLGMFIDSSLTVGGSLDVTGPTTIGGTVEVTGDATFSGDTSIGGNAAITGTLSLPAGIIDNDALTSPITRERIYGSASNFNLTTAYVVKLTKTLTVPAGFTSAAVYCTSRVFALNSTAGLDYLYSFVRVDTIGVAAFPLGVSSAGGSGTSLSATCVTLDGLTPGSTFDITVWACSNFATWAANVLNVADVNGIVIWTR